MPLPEKDERNTDIEDDGQSSLELEEAGEVEPYDEEETQEYEAAAEEATRGAGDAVRLYFFQSGKVPLLKTEEERSLGNRIEVGRYLTEIESKWASRHGRVPGPVDLLLIAGEDLSRFDNVFEALCRHLEKIPGETVKARLQDPELRRVIDGPTNPDLSRDIAEVAGTVPEETERQLIRLSIISKLVPWNIVEEAAQKSTLRDFGEVLRTSGFRKRMERRTQEVADYFNHVREDARHATDHLVRANLRLVIAMAKKNMGRGMALLDLIQEGNIGLMHATDKYDYRRGYRFSTYATWWIRQSINRAIAEQSRSIRLPVHIIETLTRLHEVTQRLSQEYGRAPTTEELARALGIPLDKMEELLAASSIEPVSLETPLGNEEEEGELSDYVADSRLPLPEEAAAQDMLREQLGDALKSLPERERNVIELRFGLRDGRNHTLEEIGNELGLTRERVRQIEKKALIDLRQPDRVGKLRSYLRS